MNDLFIKLMCCFVDNMTGNCTVYISTCRFRISQLNCWSFLSITNRHHIISSNHMHWQCILYIQLFVAVFLFGFVSNRELRYVTTDLIFWKSVDLLINSWQITCFCKIEQSIFLWQLKNLHFYTSTVGKILQHNYILIKTYL